MANKDIIEYLQRIKKVLPTQYGGYTLPARLVKPVLKNIEDDYQPVHKISYEGLEMYVKTYGRMYRNDPQRLRAKFTSEIMLSRLYNELGIPSATYYPVRVTTGLFEKKEVDMMVSQSILDIPGVKTKQGVADDKFQDIISVLTHTDTLTIEDLIKRRKEIAKQDPRFADDNFFGELVTGYMADYACALQIDRTLNNQFVHDKGVVLFDHERTMYDRFFNSSRDDFKKYIEGKGPIPFTISSLCPVRKIGETWQDGLKGIARILDSGVLGAKGEEFRNRLANLDYYKFVENVERDARYPLWPDFVDRLGMVIATAQNEICPQKTK